MSFITTIIVVIIIFVALVLLWYLRNKDSLIGKMTSRKCPKCEALNQSRAENIDWNCFKCGGIIPPNIKCPECGKLAHGTLTDDGVRAALCPDCYKKVIIEN